MYYDLPSVFIRQSHTKDGRRVEKAWLDQCPHGRIHVLLGPDMVQGTPDVTVVCFALYGLFQQLPSSLPFVAYAGKVESLRMSWVVLPLATDAPCCLASVRYLGSFLTLRNLAWTHFETCIP